MKRRYRRYFVILEVEDKSFGTVKNEGPRGHGKIEVKNDEGLLSINCQGLKKHNGRDRYRWYLINTGKEGEPTIVEVGPMEVDDKGKGEIVWEFNTENVKGSMESIDDFNVLVLAFQSKDSRKNLVVPLVGYIDKEKSNSWRYALEKYLYIPTKKEDETDTQTQEESAPQQKEALDTKQEPKQERLNTESVSEEEKLSAEPVPKEEINIEVAEPSNSESAKKETSENEVKDKLQVEEKSEKGLKEAPLKSDEDLIEGISKDKVYIPIKDNIEEVLEEEDSLSFSVQMQAYIENALKEFPKVEPFFNNLEDYTWWQIPYNYQTIYRSYMPFILYVDSLNAPANYYRSKMLQTIYLHRHHIFGVSYDKNGAAKSYAYGILGRKLPSEQPYEGATGFTYWHPCDPKPHDIYDYGYWILRIDPKTGKVVHEYITKKNPFYWVFFN